MTGIKKGRWTVKKPVVQQKKHGQIRLKFWQKTCRPKIAQDKYCVNNPLNFRRFILKNNPWLVFCQNGAGKTLGEFFSYLGSANQLCTRTELVQKPSSGKPCATISAKGARKRAPCSRTVNLAQGNPPK